MTRERTDAEILMERAGIILEHARHLKKQYKQMEKELVFIRQHAQSVCTHHYADGTPAWRDRGAYSICKICSEAEI